MKHGWVVLSIQLTHFSSVHHPGPTRTVPVSCDVHLAISYSSFSPADCSTPGCIPGTQPLLPRDNSIASPLRKQATIVLCTRNLLLTAAAEQSPASLALLHWWVHGQAWSHAHLFQITSLLWMNACIPGLNAWIVRRECTAGYLSFDVHICLGFAFISFAVYIASSNCAGFSLLKWKHILNYKGIQEIWILNQNRDIKSYSSETEYISF